MIPKREQLARLLLAVLIAGILGAAAVCRWHSVVVVDTRTYLEMIAAIADHGVPSLSNGPVGRFPELQARWNRVADGQLWGSLPPVFPYLAAPAFVLGGARGVIRFNIALLGALAVACFLLGRRLTRDPLCGTASAWVVLLSTPVWNYAVDVSPYPLSITALAFSAVCCLEAMDSPAPRARWYAIATGVLCGLAIGAHLTTFAIAVVILAALLLLPAPGCPPLVSEARSAVLAAHGPSRDSLVRGAWGMLGALIPLAAVGALNHRRFHSWNPLSYGPCAWHSCAETGLDKQSIGFMLEFAAPVIAWAVVTIAVVAVVWRHRTARIVVIVLAVLALIPPSSLHDRATALFSLAYGFIVDITPLDLRSGFVRAPDRLGIMLGPYVIKSTLQSTPVLALAVLARGRDDRTRGAVWMLSAAAAALYAVLTLRANLPVAFALGYPFLHLRYTMPALPFLAVLAILAVRELPFRWAHAALCAVVAAALTAWFVHTRDDGTHLRRLLIVRGTLGVAAAAFVLLARGIASRDRVSSQLAAIFAAIALGLGFAETAGIDFKETVAIRNINDRDLDAVAGKLPARFALVGWPREIDPVLVLKTQRDIEYADLYESQNWVGFRGLIDHWTAAGRPIYALFPKDGRFNSPWPDVRFDQIDATLGLYRVLRP